MKKVLLLLLCLPLIGITQVTNYNVTINSTNAWQGNLFYQKGGDQPRPVKILDPSGAGIFSQNMGMKGWDFKVNDNNKILFYIYDDGTIKKRITIK
tara:strand:+ start:15326 stop:15613 length:288 start_codon:yes stop_codon:yes gene_type:complete